MSSPDENSGDEISTETADVIDWDEAMEQVAGDEEFLHELLNDFKDELATQMDKLGESISMVSVSQLNKTSLALVIAEVACFFYWNRDRTVILSLFVHSIIHPLYFSFSFSFSPNSIPYHPIPSKHSFIHSFNTSFTSTE